MESQKSVKYNKVKTVINLSVELKTLAEKNIQMEAV